MESSARLAASSRSPAARCRDRSSNLDAIDASER